MANFGLILVLCGTIIAAFGGFIWNKYSSKANSEKHIETLNKNDEIKNEIIATKETLSKKQDQLKGDIHKLSTNTDQILMEKKTSYKPEIKIENSPNAIIQVNTNGDNNLSVNPTYKEPTFKASYSEQGILIDNYYRTVILLEVSTERRIMSFIIYVKGKTIQKIDFTPSNGGVFTELESSVSEKLAFKKISPVENGPYYIMVYTKEKEEINISYDYKIN